MPICDYIIAFYSFTLGKDRSMLNYAKVSSGGGQTVGGGSNDIHRVLHSRKAVLNYPGMKVKPIQIFSYACVILGVLSILIQVNQFNFE